MKQGILLIPIAFLLAKCSTKDKDDLSDLKARSITEIQNAERSFQVMTVEKGIHEAFRFYADSNAVMKRENDTLVRGREGIRNYYSQASYAGASVNWLPDFTDASAGGDFGYTYGRYTWRIRDSAGKVMEKNGVFHTVWKKQADGNWKYVWD
ncbi:MAG: nuclear transport factor 2 family protein [Chitinophagaceae bacterium]|nr:MAG: nuclear transport factor 2 family protein [Chitinophagaceae bacterium]